MKKNMRSVLASRLLIVVVAGLIAASFAGCKSQKKIAAEKAAAERAAKIEQAKQDLLLIINDKGDMSLQEKEDKLSEVKGMMLEDPEVDALAIKAEELIAQQKAEVKRLEDERRRKEREAQQVEESKFSKIESLFDEVARPKSMQMADNSISETLRYFASPDVPVLIIVWMDGADKDYDRPTTIRKYLDYLKDKGKNVNKIHNVQFDANGKITELELIKE